MKFYNLRALWFLFFIPLVILMYILKQKFVDSEISSIFLWNEVLKDIEVNTPWQKLKKNLLLLLQLIIIFLIVISLTEPYLLTHGKQYSSSIIVIDTTGSMAASFDKNNSRLEEGKKRAINAVKSFSPNTKITVISAAKQQKVEVSGTDSKEDAIKVIKNIKGTNSTGNIEESVSLVKSIGKQYGNYNAIFYSDRNVDISGINGEVVSLFKEVDNVSLDYISHTQENNMIKVLLRVTNRSLRSLKREISLFGDNKIIELRDVELKEGETQTIYFDVKLGENINYLSAEISEEDGLLEDNAIFDITKQPQKYKILMMTDKNIFIEKALLTLNNVEIYKANSTDKLEEKYDLYIFDTKIPDALPENGSIMLINPEKSNELVEVKGEAAGGEGEFVKNNLLKYAGSTSFIASEVKSISIPSWGSEVLKVNDNTAAYIGQPKGRKICIIGFDIHKSDIALTPQFPIFIHNAGNYLLGSELLNKTSYMCGDTVELNILNDAKSAYIAAPDNSKYDIQVNNISKIYEATYRPGLYKFVQSNKDKTEENLFAVNFPSEEESNINLASSSTENSNNNFTIMFSGINLQLFLLLAVLVFAVIEWVVYIYGN